RARELQKRMEDLEDMWKRVHQNRLDGIHRFEQKHIQSIKNYDFKQGDLVIARNTRVEKTFSAKNQMRYMGPLIVIRRNRGGAYIVAELDGTVWRSPVGALRVIPYLSCSSLPLPNLDEFLDISTDELAELEALDTNDDTDGELLLPE
ncbi:hypothetical protein GG344DRAFT_59967, partial [Lentinula edodes]